MPLIPIYLSRGSPIRHEPEMLNRDGGGIFPDGSVNDGAAIVGRRPGPCTFVPGFDQEPTINVTTWVTTYLLPDCRNLHRRVKRNVPSDSGDPEMEALPLW
jgi:hypothetical protein